MTTPSPSNPWSGAKAILFDLDGVLTPTADVHEEAWQHLFDGYLSSIGSTEGYRGSDYFEHIDGKPRFVLEIRPKENKVIVGPHALLAIDSIQGIKVSWAGLPIADVAAGTEFDCYAQVRAHGDPVPARAFITEETDDAGTRQQLHVTLVEPLLGVAPGQTIVLYQGSRVLGQATIDTARSLARPDLP